MKLTIYDAYQLEHIMKKVGRNWYSTDAYEAMIEFYDEFDEGIEVDPVAICCEWTEYSPNDGCLYEDYGYIAKRKYEDLDEFPSTEQYHLTCLAIENETTVLYLANGNVLVQMF